ncbi:unnamed protein product [Ectocarpus sp. CCAP 1310/34]|nr:unnamed protein product [Ectocarpus sp. CCAP 1310/34]
MPPRTTRRSTAAASAAASSTTASSAAAPASSAAAAPAAAAAASAAASAPMGPLSPPPPGLPPRPDRQTAAFVDATTAAYALPCYTALVPGAGATLDLGRVFDRLGCDQGSVEELVLRLGEVATRLPPLPAAEVYTAVLARARMVATSRAGDKSVSYRQAEAKKLLTEYIVELALRHGRLLQSEGCVLFGSSRGHRFACPTRTFSGAVRGGSAIGGCCRPSRRSGDIHLRCGAGSTDANSD